jgi:polysaccharide export outer membrane protein
LPQQISPLTTRPFTEKVIESAMKYRLLLAFALCLIALPIVARAQDQRPPRLTTVTEDRYRLQPGDVLEIQFRYTPEFNQTVTVQPDGYVSLEITGDLKIAGFTLEQTRAAILRQASQRLQDPVVSIMLKEFQKPYFVVAGEVAQPGKIEMREKVTALQAIMLAGGMKETAKSSQVVVFRKINSDTAEVKLLNLKSIKQTADLENDLTLQAGDMVYVPRDKLSKVERFMKLVSVAAFLAPRY